jgi:hypothetical protein
VPKPRYPILTTRQLNRATLARQLLLAPANLDPVAAIEQVGGLQAQEPASPYIALWSRLRPFDPVGLERAFSERRLVKATLMRVTLHAVSRGDYAPFLQVLRPMLGSVRRTDLSTLDGPVLDEIADAVLEFASRPRSSVELRDEAARLSGAPGEEAWWRVRRRRAFVYVPTGDPWSFGRRPFLAAASAWLHDDPALTGELPVDRSAERFVRRYLGAFGPATAADLSNWSGVSLATVRPGLDRVEAAGELARYSDEAGRTLLDLVGAALPDPDVPAPPRLLPMWDSVLLAHHDRTRVLPQPYRPVVIARNGDVLPTFLVDGQVAGLWWAEPDGGRARVVLEPFAPIPARERAALDDEAERLAAFLSEREPAAYGRYRRTRARRMPPAAAPLGVKEVPA